jgi:hypothetical protein
MIKLTVYEKNLLIKELTLENIITANLVSTAFAFNMIVISRRLQKDNTYEMICNLILQGKFDECVQWRTP